MIVKTVAKKRDLRSSLLSILLKENGEYSLKSIAPKPPRAMEEERKRARRLAFGWGPGSVAVPRGGTDFGMAVFQVDDNVAKGSSTQCTQTQLDVQVVPRRKGDEMMARKKERK